MTELPTSEASERETRLAIRLADDGVSIDQDLACYACHYNLRMQPRDGTCPECAASIETTIAKRMLVLLNPKWLNAISAGAAVLSYGIPTVLFVFVLGNALLKLLSFFVEPRNVLEFAATCIGLVSLIGIWLFTKPLKTDLASKRLRRSQLITRLAAVGLMGAVIALFNIPLSRDITLNLIVLSIGAVFMMVMVVSFAVCCGEIAAMLSDQKTRRRSLVYGAVFGLGWLMTVPVLRSEFYGMRPAPLFIGFFLCGWALIILIGFLILVLPNYLSKQLQAARSEASEILNDAAPPPTQMAHPVV